MRTVEELEALLEVATRERDEARERADRFVETVRRREQEHLDACAEADEYRAERDEARAIVGSCWLTYSEGERDKARAWAHKCERERDEARAEVNRLTDERDELLVRVADQGAELRATREAYNEARTDVPALIARVRELEDHTACLEALLREKTEEADELDDERREAWAHIHEHASARSRLILKAIHGALTDALPSTPIPALDSFDVVELVRNIVSERDQALADYQDLGRVMHDECARLEAECERMKTFAAQNFSAMIRQEAEQMRAYGLSHEGVRKVLREYDDGEISLGKLMDLIRAAARAMAEDMQK